MTTLAPLSYITTEYSATASWPLYMNIIIPIICVLIFFLVIFILYRVKDPGMKDKMADYSSVALVDAEDCKQKSYPKSCAPPLHSSALTPLPVIGETDEQLALHSSVSLNMTSSPEPAPVTPAAANLSKSHHRQLTVEPSPAEPAKEAVDDPTSVAAGRGRKFSDSVYSTYPSKSHSSNKPTAPGPGRSDSVRNRTVSMSSETQTMLNSYLRRPRRASEDQSARMEEVGHRKRSKSTGEGEGRPIRKGKRASTDVAAIVEEGCSSDDTEANITKNHATIS